MNLPQSIHSTRVDTRDGASAWFDFSELDQGADGVRLVRNLAATNNNGQVFGTPALVVDQDGTANQALRFATDGDYVQLQYSPLAGGHTDFSYSMWLKVEDLDHTSPRWGQAGSFLD